MSKLHFTQAQVREILTEIANQNDCFNHLMKLRLEALMCSVREEYNFVNHDMSNGYRIRRTFRRGKILELQVPRSRRGNFYPLILWLLRDQEEECRQLAFSLYEAGLTT